MSNSMFWLLLIAVFLLRDAVGAPVLKKSGDDWAGASVYTLDQKQKTDEPTPGTQLPPDSQDEPGTSVNLVSLSEMPSVGQTNSLHTVQGVLSQTTSGQRGSATWLKGPFGAWSTGQANVVPSPPKVQSPSGGFQTRPVGDVASSSQSGYSTLYSSSTYHAHGMGQSPASLAPMKARLFTSAGPPLQLGVTTQTSDSVQSMSFYSHYTQFQSTPSLTQFGKMNQAPSSSHGLVPEASSSYGSTKIPSTRTYGLFNQMDSMGFKDVNMPSSGSAATSLPVLASQQSRGFSSSHQPVFQSVSSQGVSSGHGGTQMGSLGLIGPSVSIVWPSVSTSTSQSQRSTSHGSSQGLVSVYGGSNQVDSTSDVASPGQSLYRFSQGLFKYPDVQSQSIQKQQVTKQVSQLTGLTGNWQSPDTSATSTSSSTSKFPLRVSSG